MAIPIWAWFALALIVAVFIAVDLLVFGRGDHEVKIRDALLWTVIWTLLGLGFGIFVWAVQSVGDLIDFQTELMTKAVMAAVLAEHRVRARPGQTMEMAAIPIPKSFHRKRRGADASDSVTGLVAMVRIRPYPPVRVKTAAPATR